MGYRGWLGGFVIYAIGCNTLLKYMKIWCNIQLIVYRWVRWIYLLLLGLLDIEGFALYLLYFLSRVGENNGVRITLVPKVL